MKKLLLLLTVLVLTCLPWATFAQNSQFTLFEDEDGHNASGACPVYGFNLDYGTCATEFIIPAEYLNFLEGATFTKMRFYIYEFNSPNPNVAWNVPYQVYMSETETTTFENVTDTIGRANATLVFDGSLNGNANQMIMDVVFDTPYQYNGGNLVVGFWQTGYSSGGYSASCDFITASLPDYVSWIGWVDPYVQGDPIFRFEEKTMIPKITFDYYGLPCPKPRDLHVYYTPGFTTATISWISDASDFEIDVNGVIYSMNDDYSPNSEHSYMIDIVPGTEYNVKVKAHCNAQEESGWSLPLVFITAPQCEVTLELASNSIYGWEYDSIEVWDNTNSQSLGFYKHRGTTDWGEKETYTVAVSESQQIIFRFVPYLYYSQQCSFIIIAPTGDTIAQKDFQDDSPNEIAQYTGSCSSCFVTIELNDPDGDNWNGNAIGVNDLTINEIIASVTPDENEPVRVLNGHEIDFIWMDGNSGNSDSRDQYSWTIRDASGNIITQGSDASNFANEDPIYYYIADCSAAPAPQHAESCEITFELTDSWGDGWNGDDAIGVWDNKADTLIATMANENLNSTTGSGENELNIKTLTVRNGQRIRFQWIVGSGYSHYPAECSWVIRAPNGDVITERANAEGLSDGDVLGTYEVSCPAPPSCAAPSLLTVDNVTNTSATISWTDNNTGTSTYMVKMGDDILSGSTTPAVSINGTTATITGLTAEHQYAAGDFTVTAICGANDHSTAVNVPAFYTGYCQPAPTSVDNNGITAVSFGTGNDVVNNTNRPTSSPYYGNYSSQIGAVSAGTTANIDITYGTSYTYGTIIWVDWNNDLNFEDGEIVYAGESSSNNPTTLTASFNIAANQALGDYRMRIAAADSYYDSHKTMGTAAGADPCPTGTYTVVHDYTLRVTEAPSCMPVTDFRVLEIEAHAAHLNWTAGGNETEWDIYVTTSAEAPTTETTPSVGKTPNQNPWLGDLHLTAATHYYAYVRARCSDEDRSDWSQAVEFTTACEAVTTFPWREKFEGYNSGNFSNICWANEHISGSSSNIFEVYSGTNGTNATKQLKLPYMSSGNYTKLRLPEMEFTPGSLYEFIIDVYRNVGGSSYTTEGVRVFASTNGEIDGATQLGFLYRNYTQTDTNVVTAENTSGWYTYTFDIPTNARYIVLRGESKSGSATYMDNFVIREKPSCFPPVIAEVDPATITSHTATLSWTAGGNESLWRIAYKNTNFDPTNEEELATATIVTATSNPTTLQNLTASTTYYVYMQSNCGTELDPTYSADWSSVQTFNTACEAVTSFPWNENFENYNAGDFNTPCWVNERIHDGTGNSGSLSIFKIYTSTNGTNSTHQLQLPDMKAGTITKLRLPEMTLAGGTDYQFVFDMYRDNNSKANEGIKIYASTNGEIEGATELGYIQHYKDSIPVEASIGWYTYEFPIPFTGTCYIILLGQSQWGTASYMDNFVVEQTPTCKRPSALAKDATTAHTATLHWTNGDANQNAWQIAYSTDANFMPDTVAAFVDVTSNPATIEGMAASTTYYAYVRANCGNGDFSAWSRTKVTFTTLAGNAAPTNLAYDNNSLTSNEVIVSWTGVATNDLHENYELYISTQSTRPEPLDNDSLITDIMDPMRQLTGLTPETTYYVWVRDNCGADGYSAWSSSINFTTSSNCQTPDGLMASEVTSNSAVLRWATYGLSDFNLRYKAQNANDWTEVNAVNSPYSLTGLAANTAYQVQVQAACNTEAWSATVDFRTECAVITITANNPFIENFESPVVNAVYNSNNDADIKVPYCWGESYAKKTSGSTPPVYQKPHLLKADAGTSGYNYSNPASQVLYFYGDGYGYAMLPEFTNPLNELQISFKWATESQTTGILYLGYITANDENYNSFKKIKSFEAYGGSYHSLRTESVYLYTVPDSAARLAFYWYANNQWGANIDDIEVSLAPTCPPLLTMGGAASDSVPHSIGALWFPVEGVEPSSYTMRYGIVNDPEQYIGGATIDTIFCIINNLYSDSLYYIHVRANCGNNDYSEWTTVSQRTPVGSCATVTNLHVDLTGNGTNSAIISWNSSESTTADVYDIHVSTTPVRDLSTLENGNCEFPQATRDTTFSLPNNTYPNFALTPNTTYYVYVRTRCNYNDGNSDWAETTFTTLSACRVPVNASVRLTSKTAATVTWESGDANQADNYMLIFAEQEMSEQALENAQANVSNWQSTSYSFNGTYGQTFYIYVANNCGNEGNSPYVYAGSVTFPNSCPPVQNLTASNVTANTVQLSWNRGEWGDETQWYLQRYLYGTYSPENTTVVNDSTVTVFGLQPETTYSFHVSAKCDEQSSSTFSDWAVVTTLAAPSDCYTVANSTTNATTNSYTPVYGFYCDNAQKTQSIYPASMLTDLLDKTITGLKYYVASGSSNNWETKNFTIKLATVNDSSLASGFVTPDNYTTVYTGTLSASTSTGMEITFNGPSAFTYAGGNLLVEFELPEKDGYTSCYFNGISSTGGSRYAYSSSYATLGGGTVQNFLPKVDFCTSPSACPAVTDLAASDITSNSAHISWMPGSSETQWKYLYSETEMSESNLIEADWDRVNDINLDLTNLTSGTTYYVYVYPVMIDSDACWNNMRHISFTTTATCLPPTNIAITDVTTSSATVYWDYFNGIVPETGWIIFYGTDPQFANGTYSSISSISLGSPFVIGGVNSPLQPNTTYYLKMQSNCSTAQNHDVSAWSNVYSFTTPCEAMVVDATHSFTENFDTQAFPPTCWSKINANTHAWIRVGASDYNHSGAVNGSAYSGFYGDVYLIMPDLVLANDANDVNLTFWSKNSERMSYSRNNNSVVLLDGNNETVLWSPGFVSGDWVETTINLNQYKGQTIRLAFKHTGNDVNGWYLDDITVEETPVCSEVTNLEVIELDHNSAKITWTSNGNEEYWDLYWTTSPEAPTAQTTPTVGNTSNPSPWLGGLTPSTHYYAYVRARCSDDNRSAWSSAVEFTTLEAIPSCLGVTNLEVIELDPDAAKITWTSNGNEEYWDLYWTTSPEAPTAETTPTVGNTSNPSPWLAGLTPGTHYYAYVRARCSDDDRSVWSSALEFTIPCPVVTSFPWTENFDSYVGERTYSELPVCWSYINTSTSSQVFPAVCSISLYSHSGNNHMRLDSYISTDPQDEYAILPRMQNINGLRIQFDARKHSDNIGGTVFVGVMTNPADASTFTTIESFTPDTTEYEHYTISFNNYTGSGEYIAFLMRAADSINYSLAVCIDDIVVEEIPYSITINQVTGGTITVNVVDNIGNAYSSTTDTSAIHNAWVQLDATADNGYTFGNYVVTTVSGIPVEIINSGFTMPAEDVTVSAQWELVPCLAAENLAVANGSLTTTSALIIWNSNQNNSFGGLYYENGVLAGSNNQLYQRWNLSELQPGSNYRVGVFAYCSLDRVSDTVWVEFTTNDTCYPPVSVSISDITAHSALLSYDFGEHVPHDYIVHTSLDPDFNSHGTFSTMPEYFPDAVIIDSYLNAPLQPGTTYYVRMSSYCNANTGLTSVWSETISFTTLQEYAVAIDADITNGTVTADATVATAGTIVNLTATPNNGYSFGEWVVTTVNTPAPETVTVTNNSFVMPEGEVNISATFTPNSYNITLNPGTGGTIVITIDDSPGIPLSTTANYNSVINIVPVPHVGYSVGSFVVTNADGSVIPTPDSSFIMPANDVTITGYFIANDYTITYMDGNTVLNVDTFTYRTAITPMANPTKEGYTFTGWDPELPQTMPAEDLSVNAQWQINTYNIVLNQATGGTTVLSIDGSVGTYVSTTANYNALVEITPVPHVGYSVGSVVVTNPDGSVIPTPEGSFIMPANDVTITATYMLNTYTVTTAVNPANAGTVIGAGTYNYGSEVEMRAEAADGYLFSNWTNAQGAVVSTDAIFDFEITNDTAFTANFTAMGVVSTPTFSPTEGTYYDSLNVTLACTTEGATIHYTTDGTTPTAESAVYSTAISIAPGDTTVIKAIAMKDEMINSEVVSATYVLLPMYEITISENIVHGSVIAGLSRAAEGTTVRLVATADNGYHFGAWNVTTATGMVEVTANNSFVMPASNVTVGATFEANDYTITYMDGNSILAQDTFTFGTTITSIDNPTKEGYTFTGWNLELPATMPDSNIIVDAQWQINSYNITLNPGTGGTIVITIDDSPGIPLSTTANYNSVINIIPVPHVGYSVGSFVVTNADGSVIPTPDSSFIMPANDVTITGYFIANEYTITYMDGNTVLNVDTFTYRTAITPMANPTKEGYTFTGWNLELPATMPDSNIIVDAQWQINSYNITLNPGTGGTIVITIDDSPGIPLSTTANYNSVINIIPVPHVGYSVGSFVVTNADGSVIPTPDSSFIMPANDVTITGYFIANEYTITYMDGNTVLNVDTFTYRTAITPMANPTKEGYTFTGWTPELPATMPDSNIIVDAQWQINSYNITLNPGTGGTIVITIDDSPGIPLSTTANYNSVINIVPVPHVGYSVGSFVVTNADGSVIPTPDSSFVMPANDVTITGYFIANEYTITYMDGNTVLNVDTFTYRTAITPMANPTKEGYTFTGWNLELPATMPDSNIIVDAQWQINSYNITLNPGTGGTIVITIDDSPGIPLSTTANYNSVINIIPVPHVGYSVGSFVVTNADGSVIPTPDSSFIMPANDVTITGYFIANNYTITYMDGNDVLDVDTFAFGTTITPIDDPTKEGYTFIGWNLELPATMPDYDMRAFAQWAINKYAITYMDGNDILAQDSVIYGAAITPIANPTKEGYTFAGWDPQLPQNMPANDVTVNAQWELIPCLSAENLAVADGSLTTTSALITWNSSQDNTFGGIYYENGELAGSNNQLYQRWNLSELQPGTNYRVGVFAYCSLDRVSDTVWVEFNTNDTCYPPVSVSISDVTAHSALLSYDFGEHVPGDFMVHISSDPDFDDYDAVSTSTAADYFPDSLPLSSLVGLNLQSGTTYYVRMASQCNTNTGLTSVWTEPISFTTLQEYAVTIDANIVNGNITTDYTVATAGTVINLTATPDNGYSFGEWVVTTVNTPAPEIVTVTDNSFVMPASDVNISATFTINSYNITLNPGTGGTIVITIDDSPGIPLSTTANYNSVINIIPVPHVGYSVGSFVVTNADGSVIPTPDSSFVMPANDVTITGYFIANNYTITYMDGNDVLDVDTFAFGATITSMANPTREGYTFTGWTPELPATMPDSNIIVDAQWQINSYNITLNPGTGGTIVITIDDSPGIPLSTTANYNSVINIIPVPHVGYSVGSFVVTNADGSVIPTPDSSFVMPANDVTITGYFIANNYTITYMDGNDVLDVDTFAFGATVTPMANPTKEGYTFTGWNLELPATMPDSNIIVDAQWQINSYNITLNPGTGGTIVITIDDSPGIPLSTTANYNSVINIIPVPHVGYSVGSFVVTNADGSVIPTPDSSFIMPANDVTITGYFIANNYTITYMDGNDVLDVDTFAFGATITPMANPTREGYTFTGWTPELPATMPANDLTVNAQWQINSYNIAIEQVAGGTITVSFAGESATSLISTTTDTSANFETWIQLSADADLGYNFVDFLVTTVSGDTLETPNNGFIMPAENVTVTATFSVNNYTITYMDGNSILAQDTFAFGATITPMANPTREGYTFTGWTPELPTTMPANDLTVNAQWQINSYDITINQVTGGTITVSFAGESATSFISTTTDTAANFETWIQLSAAADYAYDFVDFVVTTASGDTLETPNNGFIMPAENVTVTAIFTLHYFNVTVNVSDDTPWGTVTGGGSFVYGSTDTLTATANDQYIFVGWSDFNTDNPRVITVTSDSVLTAYFIPEDIEIISDDTLTGSVNVHIPGGHLSPTSPIVITAVPEPHYHFVSWSDGNTDNPRTILPIQAVGLTAIFAIDQHTVTVLSNDDNMGMVDGSATVDYGSVIQISATAYTGYVFISWNDGNTENPRYITVECDTTFTATFQLADGIEDANMSNVNVYSYNDQVVIANAEGFSVEIFDMSGRLIVSENSISQSVRRYTINTDGIYLVKVGNNLFKKVKIAR